MSAALWLAALAAAGVHTIEEGQTVSVPLNTSTGTVVQLPSAVRMVTPTTSVLVERVEPAPAPASKGKPAPVAPVLHLRVRVPDGTTPTPELVTFVLTDGHSVPVRFVPGGPGADPFADLQLPPEPVFDSRDRAFLSSERRLMAALFADEGFRREELDEEWSYAQYPHLSWTLRRRFRDGGLTGYVFELSNTSRRQVLTLSAPALAVGRPNRAVLVALEDERLVPCREASGPCTTLLRMVVRNEGATPSALSDAQHGEMPFVMADKEGR